MASMTERTSTRDMCLEQAKATVETLEGIWDAQDTGEEYGESDPLEYLDEMPLEIVFEAGEPFAIVLGTGGPHVEIRGGTRHDGSSYAVHVYWSGEHVTYGHSSNGVQRTGEYFRERVEESGN